MRPRWRVQVCDSASSSEVECLSGQGFFDEISVGEWLHVEWQDKRLWWARIVHTHVWVAMRAGRACEVLSIDDQGNPPGLSLALTLDGPWSLRAFDRGTPIERQGRGRVEEVWVKDWLHVERVASHHARVRIGDAHFDVRVEGRAALPARRRACHRPTVMHEVRVAEERLAFPSRCVRCASTVGLGAVPLHGMERPTMPLCERCRARGDLSRAAWIVGAIAGALALTVGLAVIAEMALPWPEEGDARATWGFGMAVALLTLGSLGAMAALRAGLRAHARGLGVELLGRAHGQLVLGVREAELAREIAAASGQAQTDSYRGVTTVTPFRTSSSTPDLLAVIGVAATVAVVGFVHAADLSNTGVEGSVHWLEAIVFELSGLSGLVGSWVLCGTTAALVAVAAGVGLVRRALLRS